ncbi:MAG: hypothetical protein ACRDDG_20170, partial [Cetobacterium sp.]
EGWLYTNGGVLRKNRYPHLSGYLPQITSPVEPRFKLGSTTQFFNGSLSGGRFTSDFLYLPLQSETGIVFNGIITGVSGLSNNITGILNFKGGFSSSTRYGMNQLTYNITIPEEVQVSYVKVNKINAQGSCAYSSGVGTKEVDWYLVIEYLDEFGDWQKGVELHNKTDFIQNEGLLATSMIKQAFKSKQFRFYIDENKSVPNLIHGAAKIFYIGDLEFGFDKDELQYFDFFQIPDEKDSLGRYKIVYVGLPLEPITSPLVYSFDKNNLYNGEIETEEKIPWYVNGVTKSVPLTLKEGYTNRYNEEKDEWELIKTHENQEGYYYDENSNLRFIPKPINILKHKWVVNKWVEEANYEELYEDYYKKIDNFKQEILDTGYDWKGHNQKCREKDVTFLGNVIAGMEDIKPLGTIMWAFSDMDIATLNLTELKELRAYGMVFINLVYSGEQALKQELPRVDITITDYLNVIEFLKSKM